MSIAERNAEATRLLLAWRREANNRAGKLDAPPVWGVANSPTVRKVAATLDPKGELQADVNRVCAEAVAAKVGRFLVRGSRPLADRGRLLKIAAPRT